MLLPVNKILCPTDFSDCSYDALKTAIELCSHFGATLCLLHVVPAIPRPELPQLSGHNLEKYEPGLAEYEDALFDRMQRMLHVEVRERIPQEIKSCVLVGKGDPANEIVRIAEGERVNLIVIATHGMKGWRQVAFGSVAERVVRQSSCPVLTVRSPREEC